MRSHPARRQRRPLALAAGAGLLGVVAAIGATASAAPMLTPLDTFGGGDGFIAPGERSYITTGATERGVAYNPLTNNVYVVSRATATPTLAILNGDTGAEDQLVSLSGLPAATFVANQIRVADDGAIYVANLTTNSTTNPFRVYRYANEAALRSNTFTTAFEGALTGGVRYGDSFNIRGGGANTQLVAGGGSTNDDLVIFTTADGQNFTPTVYNLAAQSDAANGVAFGEGDTVYTKQVGDALRLFSFSTDPGGSLTLQQSYLPGGATGAFGRIGPIDTETLNDLLAALSIPSGTPSPDSARLYDISDPAVDPVELDSETFPVDFANANVAGSVDFGNGRLYVLDTGNGLLALQVPEPASLGLLGLAAAGLLGRRRRA